MGLDQSWLIKENGVSVEIYYHRKVPALEKFMADEWAKEHDTVFNCEELSITSEILDRLMEALDTDSLETDASGFFWGRHYPEDMEDIKEAVGTARSKLAEGIEVYYSSWW